MRYVKAVASIAACMTMVATAVVGVVAPAHAADRLQACQHPLESFTRRRAQRRHPPRQRLHLRHARAGRPQGEVLPRRDARPHGDDAALRLHGRGGNTKSARRLQDEQLPNGKHTLHISVDQPNKQHSSYTAHFIVKNPPPKPSNVKAKAGAGTATLTWGSHSVAARFYIYRGTSSHVALRHPIATVKGQQSQVPRHEREVRSPLYYVVQVGDQGPRRSNSRPSAAGRWGPATSPWPPPRPRRRRPSDRLLVEPRDR